MTTKDKNWKELFRLLDVYLDLEPEKRQAWLDELEDQGSGLKAQLTEIIAQREELERRAAAGDVSMPGTSATGGHPTGFGDHAELPWERDADRTGVAPPQVGTVLRQRFTLVEELGRGGMGVVFKALDRLKQEAQDRNPYVALKILNEEFSEHPDGFTALQREARRANTLPHPNVITVYDFDRDGPYIYLTMEYLKGRPLDDLMKTDFRGGTPFAAAWPIVRAVGAALECAHEHGIVHCDLKPSNVFRCDNGRIKVLDFGIARRMPAAGQNTVTTLFDPRKRIGALTHAYASLEMLTSQPADPRDDVYALGCLTYQLVSGAHPFEGRDAREALERELTPRRLTGLTRLQWRGLKRALALQRAPRCASIGELLRALTPRSRLARVLALDW